ncbi:MAG: hypothetical protein HQK60_01860, partial [Deltaproteobacteria bacterium]|nr:hypothetical protein [Deltaproteobacteria bacterium]
VAEYNGENLEIKKIEGTDVYLDGHTKAVDAVDLNPVDPNTKMKPMEFDLARNRIKVANETTIGDVLDGMVSRKEISPDRIDLVKSIIARHPGIESVTVLKTTAKMVDATQAAMVSGGVDPARANEFFTAGEHQKVNIGDGIAKMVVSLHQGADAKTVLHEWAHSLYEVLPQYDQLYVRRVLKPLKPLVRWDHREGNEDLVTRNALRRGAYEPVPGGLKAMVNRFKESIGTMFNGLKDAQGKRVPIRIREMAEEFRTGTSRYSRAGLYGQGVSQRRLYDSIDDSESDRNVWLFKNALFVNDMVRKSIPDKGERQLLPFLIERTLPGAAELDRLPNVKTALEKLTPERKAELEKYARTTWKNHMDELHSYMMENLPVKKSDRIGYLQDYVTHMWKFDNEAQKDAYVSKLSTYNRFKLERSINTLADGLKDGLTPRFTDAAHIAEVYGRTVINATATRNMIDSFRNFKDLNGEYIIKKAAAAPRDWTYIDNPILQKSIFEGPIKVNPEYAKEINLMLKPRIEGKWIARYETMNAVQKAAQLGLSLFHMATLAEHALMVNPAILWRGIKGGKNYIFDHPEASRDAIGDGLKVEGSSDVFRPQIDKMIEKVVETTNLGKYQPLNPLKWAQKFKEVNDSFLWDTMHTNYKLMAYEHLKGQELKRVGDVSAEQKTLIGKDVARYVNDLFGGQAFHALMINPRLQQGLQAAMLSPDWTFSVTRTLGAIGGLGATIDPGFRQRMALKSTLPKAFMYLYVPLNLMNYAVSKYDDAKQRNVSWADGKGHFMWENNLGNALRVQMGRDSAGAINYFRPWKIIEEGHDWIYDPRSGEYSFLSAASYNAGRKAAPNLQWIAQFFTDKSLAGFENKDLKNTTGWARNKGMVKMTAGQISPFSIQAIGDSTKDFTPMNFMYPVSRGTTEGKADNMFQRAIKNGDEKMITRIMDEVAQNQGDPMKAFKMALSRVQANTIADMKKQVKAGRDVNEDNLTPEQSMKLKRVRQQIQKAQMVAARYRENPAPFQKVALAKYDKYTDDSEE